MNKERAFVLGIAAIIIASCAVKCHAFDGPYFTGPGTNVASVQASMGAVMNEKGIVQSGAFGSVGLIYHDADANNSIIPASLQAYIPPEAWTLVSLGYGAGLLGIGANVNLGATAQGYVSEACLASNNASLEAFGAAVKPGASGLAINAGPEWFAKVVNGSTVLPFDQIKGTPGWFIGGAYTKRF